MIDIRDWILDRGAGKGRTGIVVLCFLFSLILGQSAEASLSSYQVTLADNRPARASSILVEFKTTQAIPPSSTITGFFPTEWTVDSTTLGAAAITVSINGVSQTLASSANSGVFGATVTGQQAILTTPTATTIAAGTSLAILYGSSGTWHTPSNAGVYPLSTSVKNSGGETIESGASYVAIAAGVGVGAEATPLLYAPSGVSAETGTEITTEEESEAPTAEAEAVGEEPEESLEEAPGEAETTEVVPEPDLDADGSVDLVDLAELILLFEEVEGVSQADFNVDGVVDIQDFGILISVWTGTINTPTSFSRFVIGPPLEEDLVRFYIQPVGQLKTASVSTTSDTVISATAGERKTVAILLSTGATAVNAIQVDLAFDPALVSIAEFSMDESLVTAWVSVPTVEDGRLSFFGGIPGGFSGSGAPLLVLELLGLASGESSLAFTAATQAVVADGLGTFAEVEWADALFSVLAEEESVTKQGLVVSAPAITSATHPTEYTWYAQNDVELQWDEQPGDIGYSYEWNHQREIIPDDQVEILSNPLIFNDVADGEWIFHLRRLCESCDETTTSRRLVRVDTTPPESFEVQTGSATFLWEEFPFLVFETTDTMSGVAYYEVEVNGERTIVTQGPFVLSFDDDGWYRVSVTAVDRAGNRTMSETIIQIGSVSSFFIATDDPVKFLIVILILILGLLAFVVWHRRTHLCTGRCL